MENIETLQTLMHNNNKKETLNFIKNNITTENVDFYLDKLKKDNNINTLYQEVIEILEETKSHIDIALFIDKDILKKKITNDNIINITGESGSGKSTYSKKYQQDDNFIVIDTDTIFSNGKIHNKYEEQLKAIFSEKFGSNWQDRKSGFLENFDYCYEYILTYLEKERSTKTIVIDTAQFRCMQDITKLKGEVIVIRTAVDNCYNRCIQRYIDDHKNYTPEELEIYKKKKLKLYNWYKPLNKFIEKII